VWLEVKDGVIAWVPSRTPPVVRAERVKDVALVAGMLVLGGALGWCWRGGLDPAKRR
jgi:hypothetical protein